MKVKPDQLVSMPSIKFDPTLQLWDQKLRFDFILPRKFSDPVKVQILLDRVHKFKRSLSKPVAYFHVSNINTLLEIAAQSLSCAIILSLIHKNPLTSSDVIAGINSAIELLIPRVYDLVHTFAPKVRDKKYQVSLDYISQEVQA